MKDCNIVLQTIKYYEDDCSENTIDARNNSNIRTNAKFHYFIIDKMLFPLMEMLHLVPPSLHITFGIVLCIFNFVHNICKQMDDIELSEEQKRIKEKNDLEWQASSLKLSKASENLTTKSADSRQFTTEMRKKMSQLQN